MSGLALVGKQAVSPKDIPNRGVLNAALSASVPNQASVSTQVANLTSGATPTYAPRTYVDGQDATFQLPSYYQTQDALNVPLSTVAQPLGVASLDGTTHVPLPQLPILGAGYIQGPYGPTAVFTGSTSNTPLKIADWNIGNVALSFQPFVTMFCFVNGVVSRPVIEVRIANSTTAVSYAAGTLVAMGEGRTLYNDFHVIPVVPVGAGLSTTPANLGPTYNVWLSAWLYDANSQGVTLSAGGVVSGAAYLLRGAL
jgi:hypothetical protein